MKKRKKRKKTIPFLKLVKDNEDTQEEIQLDCEYEGWPDMWPDNIKNPK